MTQGIRPLTDPIPSHLTPFIVSQDASLYTPIDHAAWRYIMRVSRHFFKTHAHPMYLDGIEETGLSIERIPLISEMDAKLRRFGWRAVAVSGFIPPSAFLEFQALGILAIACDMRKLEHIAYTPAPDIVHEAAGHAPIVADPEYREYLSKYGEVAHKAIYSKNDIDVYEAVRDLSDIKENPASTKPQVQAAQQRLEAAVAAQDYTSESTQLTRMAWWTTEYGLIGNLESPLVYGAGLLSSIGESYHCFDPRVRKIPFTLDCINRSYDITRPQPQLFVASSFKDLSDSLEEFASTMAFRVGGLKALAKAKAAEAVTTTILESGLGISGTLESFLQDDESNVSFIKWSGPVQLSFNGKEIEGHGPRTHAQGFSSPLGELRSVPGKTAAEISEEELRALGFKEGRKARLLWKSGFELHGEFTQAVRERGRNLVLSFKDCSIRHGDKLFYDPAWGAFDLACGAQAHSVQGGAGDRAEYLKATGGYRQKPQRPKSNLTPENAPLCELYQKVRDIRESGKLDGLVAAHDTLAKRFPNDWLLRLETLEIARDAAFKAKLRAELETLRETGGETRELIDRGLEIL